MIDQQRTAAFLESLETDDPSWIEEIRQYGRSYDIPIVKRETAALLLFMLRTVRAEQVLEIGTAIGYSALLMAEKTPGLKRITTVEIKAENAAAAGNNFAKAASHGVGTEFELIEGDAKTVLPDLDGPYDLIFLDGAKAQYEGYLPQLKRLLRPGGVLFADNVLQEQTILESRFLVERRDRTTHARMRAFLYRIKHDEELVTSIVPVGDGVSLSIKV